ncbi:MAG TPA: hypothetical protein PLO57_03210 [Candidatus Cloacimonadota bacterium]|nr:hypothetical protein [Candidatus Cloacimonas acidaminovorans]HPI25448.1 hypothetical protein [Candidatus Cloacimonadota bacterium]HQP62504.1 hypothetical protein [Candidatus Cloacimonas sp.]
MMDTTTIIQLIGLVFTSSKTVFDLKAKSTPPKDFKLPLTNQIRRNVAILKDFFKSKPKKKTREDIRRVSLKLKTESYNKLINDYVDLKKAFGKKKTNLKHEPLYESIHIFYYKIGELQELIYSKNIRPGPRMNNIHTRGCDILEIIRQQQPKQRKGGYK